MDQVILDSGYNTLLFYEIYPDLATFLASMGELSTLTSVLTTADLTLLYYMLYAKYGYNPIANESVDIFEMKVATTIYQHGPIWKEKLAIQKKIRDLTDTEIVIGGKQIVNNADNPQTSPSTSSLSELDFINHQATNNVVRAKLDAFMAKWDSLRKDATEEFIGRFKHCFTSFVIPVCGVRFINDIEEEEI